MTQYEFDNLKVGDKVICNCIPSCFCGRNGKTATIISLHKSFYDITVSWDDGYLCFTNNGAQNFQIMHSSLELDLLHGGARL